MGQELTKLQQLIGYQFQDIGLLRQSLTHRSHGTHNNERLEFLGDSILSLVITRSLYDRFPKATEGQLSRLRASMVRRTTLAEIAREITIGDFLIMGRGELKSGGFSRDSILSNAVEGVIGAIYLDGGLAPAGDRILTWYESKLNLLSPRELQKDAKSSLQEYLQGIGAQLPVYEVIGTTGKSHNHVFIVECRCEVLEQNVIGEGSSRRVAEQVAAKQTLALLGIDNEGPL